MNSFIVLVKRKLDSLKMYNNRLSQGLFFIAMCARIINFCRVFIVRCLIPSGLFYRLDTVVALFHLLKRIKCIKTFLRYFVYVEGFIVLESAGILYRAQRHFNNKVSPLTMKNLDCNISVQMYWGYDNVVIKITK